MRETDACDSARHMYVSNSSANTCVDACVQKKSVGWNRFMELINSVTLVQFEVFAVAALLSGGLFSMGFLLGRVSKSRSVKVPMEVIHALATPRFDARSTVAPAREKDAHAEAILHGVEAILKHVHDEKDFKKAQAYALHEIEKLEHDHGATKELKELHDKVAHAHNKAELEAALQAFIDHAHHH